jgi:dATP pyrophosphohydrolase
MALCFIGLFDAILTLINASSSSVIYGEGTIMPRAPFQVLVYPYHRVGENDFVYALFKRSDAGYWQAIAGGGEDNETPLEAAKRETFEEAGIARESDFIQLDTIESVPVTEFSNSHLWGNELYVIPQYCFGVLTKEEAIVLSHEHSEYRWLTYQEAAAMVKFDGNRTALWELDRRLRGKGPRG